MLETFCLHLLHFYMKYDKYIPVIITDTVINTLYCPEYESHFVPSFTITWMRGISAHQFELSHTSALYCFASWSTDFLTIFHELFHWTTHGISGFSSQGFFFFWLFFGRGFIYIYKRLFSFSRSLFLKTTEIIIFTFF